MLVQAVDANVGPMGRGGGRGARAAGHASPRTSAQATAFCSLSLSRSLSLSLSLSLSRCRSTSATNKAARGSADAIAPPFLPGRGERRSSTLQALQGKRVGACAPCTLYVESCSLTCNRCKATSMPVIPAHPTAPTWQAPTAPHGRAPRRLGARSLLQTTWPPVPAQDSTR